MAATNLFLERGYDLVTLDEIVQIAHVSKTTIYSIFGTKEALLEAVLANSSLPHISKALDTPLSGDIQTMLHTVGVRYLKRYFAPQSLAVMRLCLTLAPRLPHIAQYFLENGRMRCAERAAALMRSWAKKGLIKIDDATVAANYFLQLLRTNHQLDALYKPGFSISDEEIELDVTRAVKIFLISLEEAVIN